MVVFVTGCELERLNEDLSLALPLLTKNEKLLRGKSMLLFFKDLPAVSAIDHKRAGWHVATPLGKF
jgi:hypothetical protein